MFVLALPLARRFRICSRSSAFVGGLSAATAMVIVESVALAIMVSNDIVMPLVLRRRDMALLPAARCRRRAAASAPIAIFVILLLAYIYYRSAGEAQLASIGLLSFAAMAQLAPAFFGGLIWRRATARGALAGMIVGILVWAYTLLLPTLPTPASSARASCTDGPFGIALLRPQALFGTDLPPLAHGVLWSLALNVLAYVGFSLMRAPAVDRTAAGGVFVPSDPRRWRRASGSGVLGDDRGTDRDGRALSRRGTHPRLVRQLCRRHAASASIPSARPISSFCATPNICSHRRSAPHRRGWSFRCCCASAGLDPGRAQTARRCQCRDPVQP